MMNLPSRSTRSMRRPGSRADTSSGRAVAKHERLHPLHGERSVMPVQAGGQLAPDGLDFGKFGHLRDALAPPAYMLSGALTPEQVQAAEDHRLRHQAQRQARGGLAGDTPITRQCL